MSPDDCQPQYKLREIVTSMNWVLQVLDIHLLQMMAINHALADGALAEDNFGSSLFLMVRALSALTFNHPLRWRHGDTEEACLSLEI